MTDPDQWTAPGYPGHSQPTAVWQQRPVSVLWNVAAVLIVLATLLSVVYAWSSWHTFGLVGRYVAGMPGVTEADLGSADTISLVVGLSYLVLLLAAAAVFLAWLWRARLNSEQLSVAAHRRGRGWVFGSWFVPVVSLWFPLQVVGDIWKTSNPVTRVSMGDLARVTGSKVVGWWWFCWLVALFAGNYSFRLYLREPTVQLYQRMAVADTIAAAADVGAAVLIILAMRQISRWQTSAAVRPT